MYTKIQDSICNEDQIIYSMFFRCLPIVEYDFLSVCEKKIKIKQG